MKQLCLVLALALCLTCLGGALAEADAQGVYVLMNIPYAEFYAAEVTNAEGIDAVSSSTLMKPRTAGLAGGSYHVDAAGSDISGIIFPVYVQDAVLLETLGGVEITDESSVEITVKNRGQETTTVFTGSDALFEAPSYSWYKLADAPQLYKTLNADGSFGAVNAEATRLDASAAFIYDRHADMAISVQGADEALADQNISGALLIAGDGTKVGLKHVENLWRKTQIGFAVDGYVYNQLKGCRITAIEFITTQGVYTVETDLAVADDELLPWLNGTYIELFPEFAKEEYKDYWLECIKACGVDDETAEVYYTVLTESYMGRLVGQEAIDAFAEDPESMIFDCYFENDVAKFTVNGDYISGYDAKGNELFCYAYAYETEAPVSFFGMDMGISLRVYKAQAEDAGIFTYFAFADDTLKETQHIEFRYGANLDDLGSYSEGEYAYWLAAGINDGYKDSQIQACIKLFVEENVSE